LERGKMKYMLEFSNDGPACVVQAIAVAEYEAIWAAQYTSRDKAEALLKSQGVIPMDSVLPLPGGAMESLDVSGQTLLYAGFRGAAARAF
jgi:hypothetical protein